MSLPKRYQPIETTTTAHLSFGEQGEVRSNRFDDFYFNPSDGFAESTHIFVAGNDLQERWLRLKRHSPMLQFSIGETGFGTGLNFIAALKVWLKVFNQGNYALSSKRDSQSNKPCLNFVSVEKYPLTKPALRAVYRHYDPEPELSALLIEGYPDPIGNCYHLFFEFDHCRVKLTLLFGDAITRFAELDKNTHIEAQSLRQAPAINAWFLDGFAPSVNDQMWSTQLFQRISTLSFAEQSYPKKEDLTATLATFTVARVVKDAISINGFELAKRPGFGRKREMLVAKKNVIAASSKHSQSHNTVVTPELSKQYIAQSACYSLPSRIEKLTPRSALVVGGGIAGCSMANALASRGIKVTLLEKNSGLAQEASGNRNGVLYGKTDTQRSLASDFYETAFHFSTRFYRKHLGLTLNGMLAIGEQLPNSESYKEQEWEAKEYLTREKASTLVGAELSNGGFYYRQAGYFSPREVCIALSKHSNITIKTNTAISGLTQIQDYDAVILATANASREFPELNWLPTRALRGQTSELPVSKNIGEPSSNNFNNIVLCERGYLLPANTGMHHCGASFTLNNHSANIDIADHEQNAANAAAMFSKNSLEHNHFTELADQEHLANIEGKTGFRCTSPDYMPLVGPIPDAKKYLEAYAELKQSAKRLQNAPPPLVDKFWLMIGFGSHGFTTAPYCAEVLADQICQSGVSCDEMTRRALSPVRFLVRQIVRST